ncbi:dual specificity protein phosphatase 22-B isoform X2 [Oryzias melastigma]|uniref:dual specificity protein phosphatase 22-B isoform X2 n=1 Tax=Oryzias melastigma TaxID=30732 RepID=UPI00168D6C40|nr:dual specificity protein phosphatase 22-B isoform X2 [Oryzias melastigma]
MGNGINKVLPDLYLGNFKDARDREALARNNITHILSIHDSAAPILQEMTYLCIIASDVPTQNLSENGYEMNTRTTPSTTKLTYGTCWPESSKSKMRKRTKKTFFSERLQLCLDCAMQKCCVDFCCGLQSDIFVVDAHECKNVMNQMSIKKCKRQMCVL